MAIELYLLLSMLAVLWFDLRQYLIPNALVLAMLLAYPVAIWTSHASVDWKLDLMGMVMVLAAGYIIFAKNWMGGGDIKLITVCALWVGWHNLADFIFAVALFGGLFAVIVWCIRKLEPYLKKGDTPLPRLLRNGEPIPYGVAIVLGFLLIMYMGKVPVIR